jgi:DNA-binding MarR family transcriptional regulator
VTKEELYNLIAERMVQPKNPISVLSQGARPNLPHFTRGEAQLYEVMGRRTKVQPKHTWRTQPVELSKCPSSISNLAHGAKLSYGTTDLYLRHLVKEGLVEVLRGTGFRRKDEYRLTPARLREFPIVSKTRPQSGAERQKRHRDKKKAEVSVATDSEKSTTKIAPL